MFLCDLHCHSSGISKCCHVPYKVVVDEAKQAGIQGIVLTNHYCKEYLTGFTYDAWIDKYTEEYEQAKCYGESVGIRVYFGVEVTMEFNRRVHLLVYGITKKGLKENPDLFDMSLAELSSLCRKKGYALIQAHPFRGATTILDTDYLDGIEINCHPLYGNTYSAEIIKTARENKIAVTCGCDYHGDVRYRPKGGMFLPDEIRTSEDLAFYLKNSNEFYLQVHEINAENIDRLSVKINRKLHI